MLISIYRVKQVLKLALTLKGHLRSKWGIPSSITLALKYFKEQGVCWRSCGPIFVNHDMEKPFGLKLFCFVSLCVFFNQFIYFSISSSCDLQLNICIFLWFYRNWMHVSFYLLCNYISSLITNKMIQNVYK